MRCGTFLAALGLLLLSPAFAPAAIQYAGQPTNTGYYENGGTVGSDFIANTSADVVALGVYDVDGDGLAGSHVVGLWTASGTLITSVTVDAGTVDPLSDGYRWVTANASLVAGQEYVISAGYFGAGVGDYIGVGAPIDPNFTFIEDRDTQGSSSYAGSPLPDPGPGVAEFPVSSDWGGVGQTAWYGPNLQVVPEPGTLVIWSLLGGLGMAVGCSRRRKSA